MITIYNKGETSKFISLLESRTKQEFDEIDEVVSNILKDVEINKDDAVIKYTEKFDQVYLEDYKVSKEEIKEALDTIDKELYDVIKKSYDNIFSFHKRQLRDDDIYEVEHGMLGRIYRPIEDVGIYVPGGLAIYPSTVLMNAIPAKLAGVSRLVMISPPNKDGKVDPSLLVAASICKVDEIYKVGGVQGIAALTYGTETIKPVYKITGPGNKYVSAAKKRVRGIVGIDMIAGPSEILIIADENQNPSYIAADLLSQAEHDTVASSILLTNSFSLAKKVQQEVSRQLGELNNEVAYKSIKDFGAIIVLDSIEECCNISNQIAPEHLELMTEEPFVTLESIKDAGSIFLGAYTPEPVGDYYAGPNHTLPTNSTARFSSPLSVDDFVKKSSIIYYEKEKLINEGSNIVKFAESEGLYAHANSVKVRLNNDKN